MELMSHFPTSNMNGQFSTVEFIAINAKKWAKVFNSEVEFCCVRSCSCCVFYILVTRIAIQRINETIPKTFGLISLLKVIFLNSTYIAVVCIVHCKQCKKMGQVEARHFTICSLKIFSCASS